MALRTNINIIGDKVLIRKMSSVKPALSEAQRRAGKEMGNNILFEARNILDVKAPNSSKNLSNSLFVKTVKSSGGWNTTVGIGANAKDYGYKVESGFGPERIKVTQDFIDWARRTVGDKFANSLQGRSEYTVRKGNNPRYDTRTGMKFFQIPFDRNKERIFTRYQDEVKKALNTVKVN